MGHQIGILTFHSSRYIGALLQAYGLRTYLKSQYSAVDFINYSPKRLTKRYELFPYYRYAGTRDEAISAFKTFVGNTINLGSFLTYQREAGLFIREDLNVKGREIEDYTDIGNTGCDRYVMGSDQIWNPDITFGLDRAFFGEFSKADGAKCFAYAASMGKDALPERYVPSFHKYIQNFDAISVREDSAIPFVKEHARCPVQAACDPVFLIGKDHWDSIATTVPELLEHRYLMLYGTERNTDMVALADRIAKEKDLSVFELTKRSNSKGNKFHTCVFPGPRKFLGLIQNAELVVTNSYHGAALSALLHVPFVVFSHSALGVRLIDLLRRLDLSDHLATDRAATTVADLRFDWTQTDKLIKAYRAKSAAFLKDCLGVER
ncbi:MAG: polysaccharide pyruvyl transferase family protein [Halobacteriota archaeon]